nr:MAG TPA: hypothetical protein [Caudoviricetes sp.]
MCNGEKITITKSHSCWRRNGFSHRFSLAGRIQEDIIH